MVDGEGGVKRRKTICRSGKRPKGPGFQTLSAIVHDYILNYRELSRRELRHFERQKSLAKAVEKAALSKLPGGKRHPHQRRIAEATLVEAARRLA